MWLIFIAKQDCVVVNAPDLFGIAAVKIQGVEVNNIDIEFKNGSSIRVLDATTVTRNNDIYKYLDYNRFSNYLESTPDQAKRLNEAMVVQREIDFNPYFVDKDWLNDKMYIPKIKRITYDNPTTVVFWTDNTKTISKCTDNDKFSKKYGVAMCFMKKIFGSRAEFLREIEKGGVKKYQNKKKVKD